jgi:hypothetical protein
LSIRLIYSPPAFIGPKGAIPSSHHSNLPLFQFLVFFGPYFFLIPNVVELKIDQLPQHKDDNTMRNIVLVFLAASIALFAGVSAENTHKNHTNNRQVAITFDDLPVNSKNHKDIKTWKEITTRLIKSFTTYKIPVVGFVVTGKPQPPPFVLKEAGEK